jgi:hypothetical protein
MQMWEYMTVIEELEHDHWIIVANKHVYPRGTLRVEVFNELGVDGWELTSSVASNKSELVKDKVVSVTSGYMHFFKRPKGSLSGNH